MIAIVTDSTAYLTHEEARQLGVVVVPMTYSLEAGGTWYSENRIEEGDEQLVHQHIETVHTSQATLSAFHNAFSRLRRAGYDVLCIAMSSRLSGTCANALLAAKELDANHIAVVDSLTTCAGLTMLIREAHMRVQKGESLAQIEQALNALRGRIKMAFSVEDMAPLRRSGRLGNVKSSISTILNIRPILEIVEGAIVSAGVARGRTDQLRKLRQHAKGASGALIVSGFLADEPAAALQAQILSEGLEVEMRRVGPVLGAHLGAGCVGLTWIEQA